MIILHNSFTNDIVLKKLDFVVPKLRMLLCKQLRFLRMKAYLNSNFEINDIIPPQTYGGLKRFSNYKIQQR